jgi:hypothetical protein
MIHNVLYMLFNHRKIESVFSISFYLLVIFVPGQLSSLHLDVIDMMMTMFLVIFSYQTLYFVFKLNGTDCRKT